MYNLEIKLVAIWLYLSGATCQSARETLVFIFGDEISIRTIAYWVSNFMTGYTVSGNIIGGLANLVRCRFCQGQFCSSCGIEAEKLEEIISWLVEVLSSICPKCQLPKSDCQCRKKKRKRDNEDDSSGGTGSGGGSSGSGGGGSSSGSGSGNNGSSFGTSSSGAGNQNQMKLHKKICISLSASVLGNFFKELNFEKVVVGSRMSCCDPCPPCYQPICVARTRSIKPTITYVPSEAPFEGLTVYRENFFPKCTDKTPSMKPQSTFSPSCAPIDGLSTYRENFTPKCSDRAISVRPVVTFEPSSAPMEGLTMYREAYVPMCTERTPSMKPHATFEPSTAPIEGREIAYARGNPYRQQQLVEFSQAPMEGLTMYRSEFFCKPSSKAESFKPAPRARFSDAKFADRSTYRNDFPAFTFECDPCMACPPNPYAGNGNGGCGKAYFCHDKCPPPDYVQTAGCATVGSCGDC